MKYVYSTFKVQVSGASCTLAPKMPAYVRAGRPPRDIETTITIEDDFTLLHTFGENVNPKIGEARIKPLLASLSMYVRRYQAAKKPAALMAGYW